MWLLLLPMLAQVPADRAILDLEHSRAPGSSALQRLAASGTTRQRQLAARALGRLEDPAAAGALMPLLTAPESVVRLAAVGAMAQLRAPFDYERLLRTERVPSVRAAVYEAAGRVKEGSAALDVLLARGLSESTTPAQMGAARGIESRVRLAAADYPPPQALLDALAAAFERSSDPTVRQLALLSLTRAKAMTPSLIAAAMADANPEVRRLAASQDEARAMRDSSPMVRYAAVSASGDCALLLAATSDASEMVALAAIERIGRRSSCDATAIAPLVRSPRGWRIRAQALVWARFDSVEARRLRREFATDTVWQVRVAAAQLAKRDGDTEVLALLARDANPNVALVALTTVTEAVRNLRSDHAGLLIASAEILQKGGAEVLPNTARVVATFRRLTQDGSMTLRDPRVALLTVLGALPDTAVTSVLTDALSDRDPAIAAKAASVLSARTRAGVTPLTTQLPIPPIPPAPYIAALKGAQAIITMKGLGTIVVDLLVEEAPVTVGVFAQLAESGQYDGLTFHRIVSNFVIQGGSPGADEYDGRTREFMRDEVGYARNARGSIGISTRGRDTGDGQIYFNLVDNYRLDRDYTVLAMIRSGLDVMDRVQEGDVIERIQIVRLATRRVK